MHIIRVGVIRGGVSPEYDVSLATGARVLEHLPRDKYLPVDILIDREGSWHLRGRPMSADQLHSQVDVAWNALHGFYGEDGKLGATLAAHGIPYTGSEPVASAMSLHKHLAKEYLAQHGIRMPKHVYVGQEEGADYGRIAEGIFRKMPPSWIIKPVNGGSSVGILRANTVAELAEGLSLLLPLGSLLVEEYIVGKEVAVGVVSSFRGEELYSFPPVEIRKQPSDVWTYERKYGEPVEKIAPARLSRHEKAELQEVARQAHATLGLRHYSSSDFIVTPKKGIYYLETNSLPGLTEHSVLPHALDSVGAPFPHFLDHVIGLAMGK